MAFQKKGTSKWYFTWREPSTNRVRTSPGYNTKREAELAQMKLSVQKAEKPESLEPPIIQDMSMDEAVLMYLRAKKQDSSAWTVKNELYYVNKHLSPLIGHIPVKRITRDHCLKLAERIKNTGVQQRTVKRRMDFAKAVLNWCEAKGIIEHAPRFKIEPGKSAVIMPPSPDELRRIVAVSPEHLIRAMVLAYYTGLRPGPCELLSLTWDTVDLEAGTLRVVSAKKKGLPWRDIPIADEWLLGKLKEWRARDKGNKTDRVIHWRGKPVGCIRLGWNKAKARAGITRRLRMYDLRHAFVTALISSGTDAATAAYLAGHASPVITLSVYRHVKASDTRKAVSNLPTVLTTSDEKQPDLTTKDYPK